MAQLQGARPLVAIALVALLLVLVCVGSAILGSGGGMGADGGEDASNSGRPAGGLPPALTGAEDEDGDAVISYASERDLQDEASSLLESYEAQGDCVLREAGFLDLFGNAWTCTVQGPDWVDVCLVSGGGPNEGDAGSEVRVVHMEADEWEKAYGQAVG